MDNPKEFTQHNSPGLHALAEATQMKEHSNLDPANAVDAADQPSMMDTDHMSASQMHAAHAHALAHAAHAHTHAYSSMPAPPQPSAYSTGYGSQPDTAMGDMSMDAMQNMPIGSMGTGGIGMNSSLGAGGGMGGLRRKGELPEHDRPLKRPKLTATVSRTEGAQRPKDKERRSTTSAGGSSCHQCKSRRNYSDLTYCTTALKYKKQQQTQGIPLPPAGSACRKKYCEHCLKKFYKEVPPPGAATGNYTWKCPSCRHICTCAACRRRDTREKYPGERDDKELQREEQRERAREQRERERQQKEDMRAQKEAQREAREAAARERDRAHAHAHSHAHSHSHSHSHSQGLASLSTPTGSNSGSLGSSSGAFLTPQSLYSHHHGSGSHKGVQRSPLVAGMSMIQPSPRQSPLQSPMPVPGSSGPLSIGSLLGGSPAMSPMVGSLSPFQSPMSRLGPFLKAGPSPGLVPLHRSPSSSGAAPARSPPSFSLNHTLRGGDGQDDGSDDDDDPDQNTNQFLAPGSIITPAQAGPSAGPIMTPLPSSTNMQPTFVFRAPSPLHLHGMGSAPSSGSGSSRRLSPPASQKSRLSAPLRPVARGTLFGAGSGAAAGLDALSMVSTLAGSGSGSGSGLGAGSSASTGGVQLNEAVVHAVAMVFAIGQFPEMRSKTSSIFARKDVQDAEKASNVATLITSVVMAMANANASSTAGPGLGSGSGAGSGLGSGSATSAAVSSLASGSGQPLALSAPATPHQDNKPSGGVKREGNEAMDMSTDDPDSAPGSAASTLGSGSGSGSAANNGLGITPGSGQQQQQQQTASGGSPHLVKIQADLISAATGSNGSASAGSGSGSGSGAVGPTSSESSVQGATPGPHPYPYGYGADATAGPGTGPNYYYNHQSYYAAASASYPSLQTQPSISPRLSPSLPPSQPQYLNLPSRRPASAPLSVSPSVPAPSSAPDSGAGSGSGLVSGSSPSQYGADGKAYYFYQQTYTGGDASDPAAGAVAAPTGDSTSAVGSESESGSAPTQSPAYRGSSPSSSPSPPAKGARYASFSAPGSEPLAVSPSGATVLSAMNSASAAAAVTNAPLSAADEPVH